MRDEARNILGDGNDEPRTLAFQCDDDRELRVRLSGDREEARVDVGDEDYELELTGREDGQRVYSDSDDEVRLTVSADQAYLRIPGGEDFRDCERS